MFWIGSGNFCNNWNGSYLHALQRYFGKNTYFFNLNAKQLNQEFNFQVKCAHALYKRTRRTTMTFSEVAEVAFANGPKWGRRYAKFFRILILQSLFWTYFGTCSVYTVLIAQNFQDVAKEYLGYTPEIRIVIAMLLLPLILLSWVPNLKYLAPVSMVANLFMGTGLAITFYYLANSLKPIGDENIHHIGIVSEMPKFLSITIFAMEAIGVVMPLENQMKTPQNFGGICGVLNKGMSGVTLVYILLGNSTGRYAFRIKNVISTFVVFFTRILWIFSLWP